MNCSEVCVNTPLARHALDRLELHRARCRRCSDLWQRDLRRFAALPDDSQFVPAAASLAHAALMTPIGLLWIAVGTRGLVRLERDRDELEFVHQLPGPSAYNTRDVQQVLEALIRFFAGGEPLNGPVAPVGRTAFEQAVLDVVRGIPPGQVMSYGAVAEAAGYPRAARAVGSVMARNPVSLFVPCHRVVPADGSLGRYGGGEGGCGRAVKRFLLAIEGISLPEGKSTMKTV